MFRILLLTEGFKKPISILMRRRIHATSFYDIPTGFFPTARRASFMRVMTDPKVGDDADVPNTYSKAANFKTLPTTEGKGFTSINGDDIPGSDGN